MISRYRALLFGLCGIGCHLVAMQQNDSTKNEPITKSIESVVTEEVQSNYYATVYDDCSIELGCMRNGCRVPGLSVEYPFASEPFDFVKFCLRDDDIVIAVFAYRRGIIAIYRGDPQNNNWAHITGIGLRGCRGILDIRVSRERGIEYQNVDRLWCSVRCPREKMKDIWISN